MALGRIVSVILRASQLIFATIVAAVTGMYLAQSQASALYLSRFIYAEVVSGLSICLCVLWIVPHSGTFTHWPFDILMSVLWWAVFGLLVFFVGNHCGNIFDWRDVSPHGNTCGKFKASIAFAFLSAMFWIATAMLGAHWTSKRDRDHTANAVQGTPWRRRRQPQASRV